MRISPFLLLAGVVWPALAAGQSGPLSLSVPTRVQAGTPIRFGQATVRLDGPWKFRTGDSPVDAATGEPVWAEPGYDDSQWETMDLTPMAGDDNRGMPSSGGWAAHGHAGYLGWAWYRLKVPLPVSTRIPLAAAELYGVDDAYQFFVDGRLLGGFGEFDKSSKFSRPPKTYSFQVLMFLLPDGTGSQDGSGAVTRTLAFRVWAGPNGLLRGGGVGGLNGGPIFGAADAVAAQVRVELSYFMWNAAYPPFEMLVLFLLALLALGQNLFDRQDHVYPWIASMLIVTGLYDVVQLLSYAGRLDFTSQLLIDDVLLDPLLLGGWAMVWWMWFRFRRPRWVPWAIGAVTLMNAAARLLEDSYMVWITTSLAHVPLFREIAAVVRVLGIALLFFVVALGIKRQGREGWIILPFALLIAPQQFTGELPLLGIPIVFVPFGVVIFIGYIANMFLAGAIALLMLRRLLMSVRRQRQMALDVKQAQEVQQVILPQERTTLPGLLIESEYHPAREVGGDFFQIIPNKAEGSLLIVAGDVTGKGLKAGMLVALLVGAIRSTAETDAEPGNMLTALNRRLLGRSDAQATCLALQIAKDGAVTLANAGHLPPYLNGEPLPMEGALPLGMMEGAEFSVMRFQLEQGDKLMLMSDGIAEATDADGHLFGFERVNELLLKAKTVAEIAGAAQAFGQEDDISIIAVTRTAVFEPSLA